MVAFSFGSVRPGRTLLAGGGNRNPENNSTNLPCLRRRGRRNQGAQPKAQEGGGPLVDRKKKDA